MPFSTLNSAAMTLRHALQVYIGPNALEEVNLRHPGRNNDEASFLRLTVWSYALLFEAGRVSIPFLLNLPSRSGHADGKVLGVSAVVQSLRTYAVHNLGLSDHDLQLSRKARDWCRDKCGTDSPNLNREWRSCFESLCAEVGAVIAHCHGAVDHVLGSAPDGDATIGDLQRRLARNWQGSRFDVIIEDALVRLDLSLNAPAFRSVHLAEWREYVRCIPDEDNIERNVVRLIERDILNHFDDILPIDGNDIMDLGITEGKLIGIALHKAREYKRLGTNNRADLLELIANDLN